MVLLKSLINGMLLGTLGLTAKTYYDSQTLNNNGGYTRSYSSKHINWKYIETGDNKKFEFDLHN